MTERPWSAQTELLPAETNQKMPSDN